MLAGLGKCLNDDIVAIRISLSQNIVGVESAARKET